ncbi:MAG TPA: LysR family transcriptional regulator [Opitutaceae bacterium]|nr:LysR family transcriptional regulator [Opitutaceae bacterium]
MTLQEISAFAAVVETGSVGAAARRLHLTQPAVSRRLQSLEDSLGELLLDRHSKPPKPTAAGRRAYGLARRLLAAADDLKLAFGAPETGGEFRFGATPRLTELVLAEVIAQLRRDHPKWELHASTGWSDPLLERVLAGTLDAAALSLPLDFQPPAGVEARRLGVLGGCVVAARSERLPSALALEGLAGRGWILNNDGCSLRGTLQQAFKARGLPFEVAAEAAGADLQLSLVAGGAGLGFVTEGVLQRSPLRKKLRRVEVRDFKPKLGAWLAFRPGSSRFQGLLESLRGALERSLASSRGPA